MSDGGVVRYAAAVAWLLLVVLQVLLGLESGGNSAALLYGSAALVGALGVIGYLRLRAARLAELLAAQVRNGEALWVAQVREKTSGGLWAESGRLVVATDGSVELRPDASSLRRGATLQSWRAGDAHIGLGRWRRDITGVRYQLLELWLPDAEVRHFGAFDVAGTLPEATTAPGGCR